MELLDIITDETVFIGLEASSQEECLQAMAGGMEKAGILSNKDVYIAAVAEREHKGSTGIGFGVAIPHGKSSGVQTPGLAFARLKSPVEWNSLDGKPVQLVFLIGVPEEAAGDAHIKILIALSRKLVHAEFREKMLAVNSTAELYQVLQAI
ncbi:MAG: putative IIA-like nitrogen-regulatory protein PtsN [Firmicutes bacterium]|nr:putative IIA-like nitrogen-regulatory protein PtsN [Bacillota bacterium]